MSLNLNAEDRASLERLEKSRMKPTRRQKAIALLRLAEGLPPAKAAEHAGIPKPEVERLAAKFAENGLAGVGLSEEPDNAVQLVRPGVGSREYHLPKGATVADLLRSSGANTGNQIIVVEGVAVDEETSLYDGAVVTVVPKPENAALDEPWRATIPSFRDEKLFREYAEFLKGRREDLGPDEDQEA
jgi:sulfur carrier protein ThiS